MVAVDGGPQRSIQARPSTTDLHHKSVKSKKGNEAEHSAQRIIAVLIGLLSERRMAAILRIRDRRQPKFVWWMRIAWLISTLKVCCLVTIMTCLLVYRYSTIENFTSSEWRSPEISDLLDFLTRNGLVIMVIVCILAIFTEVMLLAATMNQSPTPLALSYAANFVLVIEVIILGCFCGGAAANVDKVSVHIMGNAIFGSNFLPIFGQQRKYQCCGVLGRDDWFRTDFFTFEEMTLYEDGNKETIANNMLWLDSCYQSKNQSCAAPRSCCTRDNCLNNVPPEEVKAMIIAGTKGDEARMTALKPLFQHSRGKVNEGGCLKPLRDEIKSILRVIGIFVFILAILTLLMGFVVIAGVLYHGAIGCIDHRHLLHRPPTKTPLVMFFMWLDGLLDSDTESLTDFSIIEELKNLDIDERLASEEDENY